MPLGSPQRSIFLGQLVEKKDLEDKYIYSYGHRDNLTFPLYRSTSPLTDNFQVSRSTGRPFHCP